MTAAAGTPAIELHPHCLKCEYDISQQAGGRCPECGKPLTEGDLTPSHIPWAHRKQIGTVRAYWRTVRMVLLHRPAIQAEFARGVSYRHAQLFRWVSVLIAWLSNMAITMTAFAGPISGMSGPFPIELMASGATLLSLPALAAWTGIPSYFFHPRSLSIDRQNRAIALSYYATAALALSPLGPIALFAGILIRRFAPNVEVDYIGWIAILVGLLFPLVVTLLYLAEIVGLAVRLLPSGRGYGYRVGLIVPVLWLLVGVLIFVGIPALVACAFLVALRFIQ